MINAMEVREDDDNFKNPVDLLFDALEEKDPDHFAVRQYHKYKLAAGKPLPIRMGIAKGQWIYLLALAVEFGAVALVGKLGDINVASMFVAAKMFDRRAEE